MGDQQDALGKLLGGLEDVLQLRTEGRGESDSRVERRANALTAQLDELSWQVRELTRETREFQSNRCAEPLNTVAHVLNAHSSELDSIQVRVDAAERKLRDLSTSGPTAA